MKNNLENAFKESLSNHELPYDSSAWTAMSAKLDAVQPITTTPPKSTLGKWIIAAGTVATVSVGAYLYLNDNNEVVPTEQLTVQSVSQEETTAPTTNAVTESNVTTVDAVESKETSSGKVDGNKTIQTPSHQGSNGTVKASSTDTNNGTVNPIFTPEVNTSTPPPSVTPEKIIPPSVSNLCEHELATIKNANSIDFIVVTPSNERITVKKKSTFKSDDLEAGNYKVYANDKVISVFTVNSAPKVDFTIDNQNPFEDGLPSLPVETFSEGTHFSWKFDNSKNAAQGRTANAHFFTKGEHTVTLTSENEAGCSAEITKTVEISSDYNLFAPNAFEPNHSDVRRTKFIPNALLVRGSIFTMIIVNPKTGATLFSTSNAADGWDGIDNNTGEMVGVNETFVWKVFLKNPLPGEKSEYSGTVIRK